MQNLEGFQLDYEETIRAAALCLAGLERVSRLNGTARDGDVRLVEDLQRASQQARNRLKAMSLPGCATNIAPVATPGAPSVTSWPTVSEAAGQYGVSGTYLRRLAAKGALEARLGPTGAYVLEPDGLMEWAARRGSKGNRPAA